MDRLVQRNVLAMSGRAVEAAGDCRRPAARQDRHHHLRQPQGRGVPSPSAASPRSDVRAGGAGLQPGRRDARGPVDRGPRRAAVRAHRGRTCAGAELVPFTAQTRMSGVDCAGPTRSARAPATPSHAGSASGRRRCPPSSTSVVKGIASSGGTPLAVAEGEPHPRRDPPQGHRQARHARALRRAADDGHPHGDDHGRQPAHREVHRRGGRCRRLHRRGHARGQDGPTSRRSRRAAASWP